MSVDWPLDRNIIRRGSQGNTFGEVRRRTDGTKKPHQGWDFFAPIGTACHAIADGKVVSVTTGKDYGLVVVHSFREEGKLLYAAYAHLSAAAVKPGDSVTRGQVIGKSGDSGNAKGMTGEDLHLHFEVRTNPAPGLGLSGRVSPMIIFGTCPLKDVVLRKESGK